MRPDEIVNKKCKKANELDKQLIINYLKGKRFSRVLDTGCGLGHFTMQVKKLVKADEIHGVEIENGAYAAAKKKGVRVVKNDLNYRLPYKSNYFDLIISTQNIEHLYFTDDYLEEMKRILKKDGVFIITTTNLAALHYRFMLLFGIQPICLHPSEYQTWPLHDTNSRFGHKSIFTHNALREVLQKHKFKIVKQYSHTMYFLPNFVATPLCKLFPNIGTFSAFIVKK